MHALTLPSKCALGDSACLCTDETYALNTQECLLASCTTREALRMFKLQQSWTSCANVPLTLSLSGPRMVLQSLPGQRA